MKVQLKKRANPCFYAVILAFDTETSYLPSRRAATVDPVEALRAE
jgi:ABC-type lipoprotein release transport system permease subunit